MKDDKDRSSTGRSNWLEATTNALDFYFSELDKTDLDTGVRKAYERIAQSIIDGPTIPRQYSVRWQNYKSRSK